MTQEEREDAVELLRCAADLIGVHQSPMRCAMFHLYNFNYGAEILNIADDAFTVVFGIRKTLDNGKYRGQLLEAALLLERMA